MGNGCLTEEHIQELVRMLNKILTEHFNRHAARQGQHLSVFRVTTCLEMSGNLEHVKEMSGMLLTVREMSWKKSHHGKVSQNCSLLDEY